MSNTQNTQFSNSGGFAIQKAWHLWFMLTIPAVLLGVLIMVFAGYGIQLQGIESDQLNNYIEKVLPGILGINHIIVFYLLFYFLKRNNLRFHDIGWRIPSGGIIAEILIGLGFGMALYLFKELVFDSLRAIIQGHTPTFTSLFNFQFNSSEIPMMIAATSLIFIEESIYRGFGINVLHNKYGVYIAVIISSIFFGLLHWGNGVEAMMYTTLMGLFFAGIFLWRNRNLIPGTVAHSLYNFLILLT